MLYFFSVCFGNLLLNYISGRSGLDNGIRSAGESFSSRKGICLVNAIDLTNSVSLCFNFDDLVVVVVV